MNPELIAVGVFSLIGGALFGVSLMMVMDARKRTKRRPCYNPDDLHVRFVRDPSRQVYVYAGAIRDVALFRDLVNESMALGRSATRVVVSPGGSEAVYIARPPRDDDSPPMVYVDTSRPKPPPRPNRPRPMTTTTTTTTTNTCKPATWTTTDL